MCAVDLVGDQSWVYAREELARGSRPLPRKRRRTRCNGHASMPTPDARSDSEGIDVPDSSGHPLLELVPAVDGVAWTFRSGGASVEWDWSAGPPDVGSLAPVRRPLSGAASKHIPVRAFSATTGSHLTLESGLEHDLLRVLDRDPDVRRLVAQPLRLTWPNPGGRRARHVPDLLSVDGEGRVTVWDVRRPEAAETDEFLNVRAMTSAACVEVGWQYEVFIGLPSVHRHNLLWLHGYRIRPVWAASRETAVLERSGAGCTLSDLLAESDAETRTVAWHLIWAGQIRVDLTSRLTSETRVTS